MQKNNIGKLHYQIYYILLISYAFSIPLWRKIPPLIIILLFINWLIEGNFKKKFHRLIEKPKIYYFFSFITFYVVHYLGLLNTTNFEFAYFDLEIKMCFLLFPLLLFTINTQYITKPKFNAILISFILGCVVSLLISLGNSIFLYSHSGNIMCFFYAYISYFYHSSYISMYIVFAIGVICYLLINDEITNNFLRYLFYFLVIIFSAYIVLLSSKAGIIGLIISSVLVLIYQIKKNKNIFKSSLFFLLFILMLFLGIKSIPSSINRITPALKVVRTENHNINMEDGTVQRIEIWKCSIEIFKTNPILGVGTGDVKDELFKKYDEKGMTFAKSFKLNSHNQYLQTAAALGIIGLLALILMFIFPAKYAFTQNNYLYLLFLILVIFSISAESMFENQAGILFFTFFNSFLFLTTDSFNYKD